MKLPTTTLGMELGFTDLNIKFNKMDLQDIKDELKEMYPSMQGFIQHTLVAEMCLKWHEKQVKNRSTPDEINQEEQFYCELTNENECRQTGLQCPECKKIEETWK